MISQIRAAKRNKSPYSLEMKLEVFTKLKAGIAPSDIASQYSISKSTISEIKNIFVPKIETILVANLYLDTRKKVHHTQT